jgi:hypothetical protein
MVSMVHARFPNADKQSGSSPEDITFAVLAKNDYLPHLLPILPPDAMLTAKSAVKPEQRGKVPGEYLPDVCQWRGLLGWTNWETTVADIEKWAAWPGVGVGLRAGVLVPVDIDIFTNETLADAIAEIFTTELGPAPLRIGNYPKRLLLYRLKGEPQGKRKIEYSRQDENGIIEILGKGNQCVAYGIHPKTQKPYSWDDVMDQDDGPATIPFDKLPEVTNEQIDAALHKVEFYLKKNGYEVKTKKSDVSEKRILASKLHPQCIDDEFAISRAIHYLKEEAPYAVEGSGGDNTTYIVACELANYGVSEDRACELMLEHWNDDKAVPPWDADDLQDKVRNAYRHNKGGFGSKRAAAVFELVEISVDKQDGAGRRQFQPYTIEQLQKLPDIEYLIKGVFDRNGLSVMYGASNCGKTFTALDMALHISLGWEWRGRKTRQGKVFYIAAEAGLGIKKRIKAFMKHHGLTYADIPDFYLLPKSVNFCTVREDAAEVIKEINILGGVEFVVIDTLSRAMAGGDENGPIDMGKFVMNCDLIRQNTMAAVKVVHHTGKDESRGSRGHYSLLCAIDTEISVTNTDGVVMSKLTKQRDGEKGSVYCSTLQVVPLDNDHEGEPITSCVLVPTDEQAEKKKPKLSGATKCAMDIFYDLVAAKGESGVPKKDMQPLTFVRLDDFRTALKDGNISAAAEPDSVNKAIKRAIQSLNEKGITATYKNMIWATGQNGQ